MLQTQVMFPAKFAAEHRDKDEVEGKFRKLNFSPSTKKTTEYSFYLFSSNLWILDITSQV